MYDAELGRFHTVDPLTEWHFNYTQYHYCFNNPINYIDPFGLDTLGTDEHPIPIEEVVCIGKKRKKSKKSSSSEPKGGVALYGEGGSNGTNKTTKVIWIDWDLIKSLFDALKLKFNRPSPDDKEDIAEESVDKAIESSRSDKEIVDETAGNNKEIIKQEINKRSGTLIKEGKYKNWIKTKSLSGHKLTDQTGDSVLLILSTGDSVLFVPDHYQRSHGHKGAKERIPLK